MSKEKQSKTFSILTMAAQYIKGKTMNNGKQMIEMSQNIVLLKESVDIIIQIKQMLEERLSSIDNSIKSLRSDINRPITVNIPTPQTPVYIQPTVELKAETPRPVVPSNTIESPPPVIPFNTNLTGDDETFIPFPDTSDIKVTKKKQTVKRKIKKDFSKKAASLNLED